MKKVYISRGGVKANVEKVYILIFFFMTASLIKYLVTAKWGNYNRCILDLGGTADFPLTWNGQEGSVKLMSSL